MNALRAFEAAARLGGFSRAAQELCVTPGAVAQQVKQLEDWAEAALFERRAQGVILTEAGRCVLPVLEKAFDGLGEAVSLLRQAANPSRVHIAALPAVAQLWLSPRLPGLRGAFPELEISVSALEQPPNLRRDSYDIALFVSEDGEGELLAEDVIRPACAPDMAARLRTIEDLHQLPCLIDSAWSGDWERWFGAVGLSPRAFHAGPSFSLYALAVQEAVSGAGVLMGHDWLIAPLVARGELIWPFEDAVATGMSLRLEKADAPSEAAMMVSNALRCMGTPE